MNIYISNISFSINDNDLKQLFEEYGEVSSAKVITDRDTGRSRGFGFVEMPVQEAALKAIEKLNQAEYDGRQIMVNEARAKEDKPRGGGGGGYGKNSRGGGGYGGGGNGGGGGYDSEKRNKRW